MKKSFLPLIGLMVILQPLRILSQDGTQTLHLNAMMQMSSESQSSYKLILTKTGDLTYNGEVYDYMDKMKAKGEYIRIGKRNLQDGHFVYYHPNGLVESEGEYVKGVKVGYWKRYESTGKAKTERYYPAESADMIRKSMELEKEEEQK